MYFSFVLVSALGLLLQNTNGFVLNPANSGCHSSQSANIQLQQAPIATTFIAPSNANCLAGTGMASSGIASSGIASSGVATTGTGEVAVIGELPIAGATTVVGNVPVLGFVTFEGYIPADGLVSVFNGCGCGNQMVL